MKIRISIFDRIIHFIVLMTLMSISTLALAQSDGGWDYFIGGYFTAVNIDAKTTSFTPAGDQEMKIDPSFSGILDNLDYGAYRTFLVGRGIYQN